MIKSEGERETPISGVPSKSMCVKVRGRSLGIGRVNLYRKGESIERVFGY